MAARVEANVRLQDQSVGLLTFDRGGSIFEYRDDLQSPDHRVLGQTFEEQPRGRRRVRVGLPAWFANLLPEGELRRQLEREMGGGRVSDFRLLLRLGADLPGAVTVHADEDPDETELGPGSDPDPHDTDRWSSLTGVQLKWSVHSTRLTMPVRGPAGWWITKLPDRSVKGLAENDAVDRVHRAVAALRAAWSDSVREEASRRFPALAEHYERRLSELPITQG